MNNLQHQVNILRHQAEAYQVIVDGFIKETERNERECPECGRRVVDMRVIAGLKCTECAYSGEYITPVF